MRGVKFQCGSIFPNGSVDVSLLFENDAKIIMIFGRTWVDFQDGLKCLSRRLKLPLRSKDMAEVVLGVSIRRVQGQGFFISRNGLIESTFLLQNQA